MRTILILSVTSLLMGASGPVQTTVPLASMQGWVQMLSDAEYDGVPLLAMSW